MSLDKLSQLLCKSANTMVLFLPRDVRSNLADVRFRYGECAIASSPREFSRNYFIRVDPV